MKLIRHVLRISNNPLRHNRYAAKYISTCHGDQDTDRNTNSPYRRGLFLAALATASLGTFYFTERTSNAFSKGSKDNRKKSNPLENNVYNRKQVAEHNSIEKGVWITYKGKVYDITRFVQHHPGGSHTIMMGAGGDVEPFWKTYTVHEAAEVQRLLSSFQIGVLSEEDQKVISQQNIMEGPYSNDPQRSILLKTLSETPYNAETPSKLLTNTYYTPNEIFFVRNHLPVPEVDLDDYRLSICSGSDKDTDNLKILAEFTLEELKTKFKPHSIDCVIQCSGNRRSDLKKLKEIKGLDWGVGAMSNARWTGVRLVDLLKYLGIQPCESIKHFQMEGLDSDMSGQCYGASISADVAFDSNREVLLAYEMNGEPLTRDHGFPVRFVAPGVTGARNVKWLSKIILSDEESNSHWQRNDYKSFSPNIDMFNLDYKQSISIQEMPVQSAICDPSDGEKLVIKRSDQSIPIRGYAYSGGGKIIVRVDVSIDGGDNWMTARLLDQPMNSDGTPDYTNRNQVWSWTRWVLEVPIPDYILREGKGEVRVLCRAFDSSYNSQPERPETIWNVRGVVNNSWHKVRYEVELGPETL